MSSGSRLGQAEIQARLESLGSKAVDVLAELTAQRVRCPGCEAEIPIPGKLALDAAKIILDKGVAPDKKQDQTLLVGSGLEGLQQELLRLPLADREALARSILPEYQQKQLGRE